MEEGAQTKSAGEGEYPLASKIYPVGGPAFFNVPTMLLVHVFPGTYVSVTMNWIPYVGASPVWWKVIAFIVLVFAGLISHAWHYTGLSAETRNTTDKITQLPIFINLVFVFSWIYHAGGIGWLFASLGWFVGVTIAVSMYYKKITGKAFPFDNPGAVEALETKAGVISHGIADYAILTMLCTCWYFGGCPSIV